MKTGGKKEDIKEATKRLTKVSIQYLFCISIIIKNNKQCIYYNMAANANYETRLEEICKKWVFYKNCLADGKDVSKDDLSLLDEIKIMRQDYISDFGKPTMLQSILISTEKIMYKSFILKPLRKAILQKDDKVFYLVALNILERSITSS